MITQTSTDAPGRRFVESEDLICPGCEEQVRCAPPEVRLLRDGLMTGQFSHQDRSPLCRIAGLVSEPVEVTR